LDVFVVFYVLFLYYLRIFRHSFLCVGVLYKIWCYCNCNSCRCNGDDSCRCKIVTLKIALTGDGVMQKLVEEQMALRRIADVAIDLFAITSVLARVSRSKSIGLQHCDHEVNAVADPAMGGPGSRPPPIDQNLG